MGAIQTSNSIETHDSSLFLKHFTKNYSFLKEIRDPELGFCQIYKHKSQSELVILKSSPFTKSYHSAQKRNLLLTENQHFLKILNVLSSHEQILCGESNKITLYSEYLAYTLEDELLRRSNEQEFFPEKELWYLLSSLVEGGLFLQEKWRTNHGYLSPKTIFVNPQGNIKLMNPVFFSSEPNAYIKVLRNPKERALLSPSLLNGLRNKLLTVKHNEIKSDVYVCGLILLYSASLCNVMDLFDYRKVVFNKEAAFSLLYSLKNRYSHLLVNIIGEMLEEQEENRPDFQELQVIIQNKLQTQDFIPFYVKENYNNSHYNLLNGKSSINNSVSFYGESQLGTPKQMQRFRPVFVSPQKINSPTIKIAYESPITVKKSDVLPKERNNFHDEIAFFDQSIEKALDRTNRNITKYKEIVLDGYI